MGGANNGTQVKPVDVERKEKHKVTKLYKSNVEDLTDYSCKCSKKQKF